MASRKAVETHVDAIVFGEMEDDQKVSSTPRQGYFSRSNNLLIKGTVEEFERIGKDMEKSETQTTTIHGKLVDAIKPAINVKISGALPILYKQELSGTPPPDGNVPAVTTGPSVMNLCGDGSKGSDQKESSDDKAQAAEILIRFQNQMLLFHHHAVEQHVTNEEDAQLSSSSQLYDALLTHVSDATGWKKRYLQVVQPQFIASERRRQQQQQEQSSSSLFVRVRVVSGIRGGKGGFGALLKSQSRQAGAKSTTNFGACRDLQGRRLRHVNDQMALANWQEWRQKIAASGEAGAATATKMDMVQANQLQTPSGVPGWHLQLPAWSDISKKERRKWQMQFRQWKRQEEAKEASKRRERELRESRVQHYVDAANDAAASAESSLQSALQEGLKQQQEQQQQQSKRQKQQQTDPPIALLALSGDVDIVEKSNNSDDDSSQAAGGGLWQIQSQSNFCTIGIVLELPSESSSSADSKANIKDMILYYEVRLVTGGLAQIGWAMAPSTRMTTAAEESSSTAAASKMSSNNRGGSFSPDSTTGDGVGDDAFSYSYDGSRGICLHESTSKAYGSGKSWQKDDLVGCMYNTSTGEISYFLNGEALGVAYTVPTKTESVTLLFPAASCNPDEILELHLFESEMQHMPKTTSSITPVGSIMATQDVSFGLIELDDDDDDAASSDKEQDDDNSKVKPLVDNKKEPAKESGKEVKTPAAAGPEEEEEQEAAVEPIDLDSYASAPELEALGLHRLKMALMARGVKCGGTLTERANRLFSLKGLAAEEYPKKLLAKKK